MDVGSSHDGSAAGGGPRRVIAHIDADAFYASVHLLEDPSLAGKPVIVAGSGARSIVTTASYEARRYGIGSAMPAARARTLCPHATFVRPDFDLYRDYSRRAMDVVHRTSEVVQPLSLDEAYLDITALDRPIAAMRAMVEEIRAVTGLQYSVGIGPNKLCAKVLSDLHKPAAFNVASREQCCEIFAGSSPRLIPGIGPKTVAALEGMGLATIEQLREAVPATLVAAFGARRGEELQARARFEHDGVVEHVRGVKSVSDETTFEADVSDIGELELRLRELAADLCGRLAGRDLRGRTIGIKVRLADFTTVTRARTIGEYTAAFPVIADVACELLRAYDPPQPVRLLGVRLAGFDEEERAAAADRGGAAWEQLRLPITGSMAARDDRAPDLATVGLANEPVPGEGGEESGGTGRVHDDDGRLLAIRLTCRCPTTSDHASRGMTMLTGGQTMAGVNQCSGAMASMGASALNSNNTGVAGSSGPALPTGAAASGASLLGGGPADIASMLKQLTTTLEALVASLGGAPTSGGGAAVAGGGAGAPGATSPSQGAAHAGHRLPKAPKKGDPRFLADTVGPTVKKGKADTVKIPDGKGFHGAEGRKQNADDRKKNNYSVTDANFSNQLGLLPGNPDKPGEKLNYVQHIQMYAAANYLESYAPAVYQRLVENQDAGKGTILGGAAHLMGLVKTADPAEAGLTPQDIASIPTKIPGTPMDARAYITSGKDITGQVWARPHHAGSQFKVLSGLINAGVDWKDAMVLAGDDGISGSGRLNGVNTQDGNKTGLNAGEREIFSRGAQIQQRTGIDVIQLMMGGHNHLGGDESALTTPKLNKLIGASGRGTGDERANAVYRAFLNGVAGNDDLARKSGTKADNKALLKHATGARAPLQAAPFAPVATQTGTYAPASYSAAPQAVTTRAMPVVSTRPS